MKMTPDEPHDLNRFVTAQAENYADALQELRRGRKETHWMWYVFPQIAGLGTSAMAQRYAIQSRAEAAAYLEHKVLGPRLRECVAALLDLDTDDAHAVLGSPDDLKLKSSMTLFAAISPAGSPFHAVLKKYYGGQTDDKTLALLNRV
jgi:uncharacterized protein (DUF1810 family)